MASGRKWRTEDNGSYRARELVVVSPLFLSFLGYSSEWYRWPIATNITRKNGKPANAKSQFVRTKETCIRSSIVFISVTNLEKPTTILKCYSMSEFPNFIFVILCSLWKHLINNNKF